VNLHILVESNFGYIKVKNQCVDYVKTTSYVVLFFQMLPF